MSRCWIVMWKEIRDNLRDKRALFFAFVYGPLLMPALMLGPMIWNIEKNTHDYNTARDVYVKGADLAPNLIQFLRSRNLDAKPVSGDIEQRILEGELSLVVEISDSFGEKLLEGSPARITIHYQKEDQESQNLFWHVRGELDQYSRQMAVDRLIIRGFDRRLLQPLDIIENDVSDDTFGSSMLANIIMFLVVFSSTMGGFYLAADINAGERERRSLEPLLSLPLSRLQVAMGKYLAVLAFCTLSYLLPIISAGIWASFLPERFFGQGDIPEFSTYLKLTLMAFPLAILLASFLMAFATFSKSMKEAQTQMGLAMMVLMTPFFVVQFMDMRLDSTTQWIPMLAQYLLADQLMLDVSYPLSHCIPSAISSLLLATALLGAAVYLYSQDEILR